jgi:hypothetical protein
MRSKAARRLAPSPAKAGRKASQHPRRAGCPADEPRARGAHAAQPRPRSQHETKICRKATAHPKAAPPTQHQNAMRNAII